MSRIKLEEVSGHWQDAGTTASKSNQVSPFFPTGVRLSRSAPSSRTRPQISTEIIQASLDPQIITDTAQLLTLIMNPVIPITTALIN